LISYFSWYFFLSIFFFLFFTCSTYHINGRQLCKFHEYLINTKTKISTPLTVKIAIYAPTNCSQAPWTDKNTPIKPFRCWKHDGKHFRLTGDETMKSFQMGRLANSRLPENTIFRLVVDETGVRHLRNEHAGFHHLGDELSWYRWQNTYPTYHISLYH
jgi:hypothetical protein